jgi:hypothetical protein
MQYHVFFVHKSKESQFVNMESIGIGVDKREALEKASLVIDEGQLSCRMYRDEFGTITCVQEMKAIEEGAIVLVPDGSLLIFELEVAWNRRQKARLLRERKKNNKKSD